MIAAVCWVPRGAAKPIPDAAEPPSQDEIQALLQTHQLEGPDAAESSGNEDEDSVDVMENAANGSSGNLDGAVATALAAASALGMGHQKKSDNLADSLAELDMDNYDDEDEGAKIFGNGGLGAAYYGSNDDDPYLANKDDEDDEEIEDMTIKESDLLIVTARNEDDVSHLEVWVYEEAKDEESNMYVHHDIMLPAFPLSLAWLDCDLKGGEKGNYVAVGTMQPEIEIWDLDVLDEVEPAVVLGGHVKQSRKAEVSEEKKRKKKKKKDVKLKEGSHSDAVLGLAWNFEYRNVLASASADCLVKIWDVTTQKCEQTLHRHSDKVQAIVWNPQEPTTLLSGSFDRTLVVMDMRAPAHDGIRWNVPADVESLAWDPHFSQYFIVSLEDGTVRAHDIRSSTGSGQKTLFTLHAHEKAVCSISYNPSARNLLATASTDKMVKLWDITNNQPSCIASINPKVGAVFSSSFCKDSPNLLAVGGSKGNLEVWDILTVTGVVERYGRRLQKH
ncbi:hypothetical protein O6H91_Y095600 [Diphasiastrum complanatum]|nr:hypothetical protein O6H91_Y095600 [Diphasiastrum complanatum]